MNGTSLTPEQGKLNELKQILPEVFTEGKLDWEKLKATLGEDINFANERYVLNWAGKSDAFKVLQTPSTKTLVPAKEESVNFTDTENIFIEGENLEVLKVLQKSYFGKVKMIYIDPPYNTGNDSFIYPDKFSESKAEYEKRVGDKDEDGYMTKDGMFKKNSKENGQYHSNWLNMMMPRLYLAKNLLRQDGVIFVSIDDNEVHNLRLLMNEVFGEENFVANFLWKKKGTTSNVEGAQVSSLTDSTLCYKKSEKSIIKPRVKEKESRNYPHNDIEGSFRKTVIEKKDSGSYKRDSMKFEIIGHLPRSGKRWQIGEETARLLENKNRFIWDGEKILLKIYDFEDKDTTSARPNLLFDHGSTDSASNLIKDLFDGLEELFDNPKPIELIKDIISFTTNPNDYILDFFAGSGTTAHAVMELNKEDDGNRKYICVQLPELCDEKSEAYKAGYKTIAEISKERIRRAAKKIEEEKREIERDTERVLEKIEGLKQQADELQKKKSGLIFEDGVKNPEIEKLQQQIETANEKISANTEKINKIETLDKGFKVLKLEDSNFKQWQQIEGKDAKALAEQMKLFVDPVSENATIENMVYELLLKSGKDLNSKIENKDGYFLINGNELALILEKVSQEIITEVMSEFPKKVIALDKLFKGNDQLKTNTVLQMKDAGIEFKTI
jgi:adenine-specific DNA-methyltransferase